MIYSDLKEVKWTAPYYYGHRTSGNGDCQYFDILVINVTQNVIRCVSLSDETMNTLKIVIESIMNILTKIKRTCK